MRVAPPSSFISPAVTTHESSRRVTCSSRWSTASTADETASRPSTSTDDSSYVPDGADADVAPLVPRNTSPAYAIVTSRTPDSTPCTSSFTPCTVRRDGVASSPPDATSTSIAVSTVEPLK